MSDCEAEDQKLELEDQFLLRLPLKQADKVRDILRNKPKKLRKYFGVDVDVEKKTGTVRLGKKLIPAKLVNLPTIVESSKTYDKTHIFKTADIMQMLICGDTSSKSTCDSFEYPHGLTPPLKNVRKKRFRKTQKNRNVEVDEEELEKELLWLVRMDNEAVASKFEFLPEETDTTSKETKDSSNNKAECELFGSVISEESDLDSSGSANDIMEYIN